MAWRVEFLNVTAQAEVEALAIDLRARLERISELIGLHGLEHVGESYVKHLEGKLWEMRLKGKDRIARALYVTVTGQRIVILRTFVKKTQKTPRREIKLALERARELT